MYAKLRETLIYDNRLALTLALRQLEAPSRDLFQDLQFVAAALADPAARQPGLEWARIKGLGAIAHAAREIRGWRESKKQPLSTEDQQRFAQCLAVVELYLDDMGQPPRSEMSVCDTAILAVAQLDSFPGDWQEGGFIRFLGTLNFAVTAQGTSFASHEERTRAIQQWRTLRERQKANSESGDGELRNGQSKVADPAKSGKG